MSAQLRHHSRPSTAGGRSVDDIVVQKRGVVQDFRSGSDPVGIGRPLTARSRRKQGQQRTDPLAAAAEHGAVGRVKQRDIGRKGLLHQVEDPFQMPVGIRLDCCYVHP